MKRIFMFLLAGGLALGMTSCSKDDDGDNNNNNQGGGNTPVDVWSRSTGTFKGIAGNGKGDSDPEALVVITKISNQEVKVSPGPGNNITTETTVKVLANDTALQHISGEFTGSLYINAKDNPPTIIYTNDLESESFEGIKQ